MAINTKFLKSLNISKLIPLLTLAYIIFVCIYMIMHRLWFSPDQFFVFGLLGATFLGKARIFFRDWSPFILFYLAYEFLRGLIPFVSSNAHILPMINFDRSIFGFIPTVKLQTLFYNPSHLMWYDYVAVTLYICHFVTPLLVGYFFWIKDRAFFKKYTFAILVLSYAAFITFIIYPAAPPWMASNLGYIPQVKEVVSVVMAHFLPTTINLPSVYSFVGGNPVAAIPSIHAAFPMMIFLFLFKWKKVYGLMFLPYVLGVWVSVVYLGDHYVVDVLLGAIYATAVFLLINYKDKLLARKPAFSPETVHT